MPTAHVCKVQYILVSCQGGEALPVCHTTPPDTDGPIFTGTQEKAVLVEGQTRYGTCVWMQGGQQLLETEKWMGKGRQLHLCTDWIMQVPVISLPSTQYIPSCCSRVPISACLLMSYSLYSINSFLSLRWHRHQQWLQSHRSLYLQAD